MLLYLGRPLSTRVRMLPDPSKPTPLFPGASIQTTPQSSRRMGGPIPAVPRSRTQARAGHFGRRPRPFQGPRRVREVATRDVPPAERLERDADHEQQPSARQRVGGRIVDAERALRLVERLERLAPVEEQPAATDDVFDGDTRGGDGNEHGRTSLGAKGRHS